MKQILFLLLVVTNSLFAQRKMKETYVVYINCPDYTVRASIYSEPKKFSSNDTLTHYWYSSNKIIQTQGGYDGKLLHGVYTSFYLSTNLMEKGMFKNGLKSGKWNSWFENGKIRETINWKKGLRNGEFKQFDEKGNLLIRTTYSKGRLNGNYYMYADNKVKSVKQYTDGKEIIIKPKEEKSEEMKAPGKNVKNKKTLKEKIKSIFKKKEKTESIATPAITENTKKEKEKKDKPKETAPKEKKKKENKVAEDKNGIK